MLQGDHVEPAAAAGPARGGAVLAPEGPQALAGLVRKLGGEGAAAHPGGVGLADPQHGADPGGADARAHAGLAGHGVRRGHVGVGAEVHVEVRPLGTLEEELSALAAGLVDEHGRVRDEGLEALAHGAEPGEDLPLVHALDLEHLREVLLPFVEERVELLSELVRVHQVDHADAAPAGLVLVGRAYAPARGADLLGGFPGVVDGLVVGHDDVGAVADGQGAGGDRVPLLPQGFDLVEEDLGVDHHAVADDAELFLVEDARGDQVEDDLLVAHHQRVPGIVAALETYDEV